MTFVYFSLISSTVTAPFGKAGGTIIQAKLKNVASVLKVKQT